MASFMREVGEYPFPAGVTAESWRLPDRAVTVFAATLPPRSVSAVPGLTCERAGLERRVEINEHSIPYGARDYMLQRSAVPVREILHDELALAKDMALWRANEC